MHKLDAMIDQIVKNVFANMKGISKSALVASRFERELADRKMQVEAVRTEFRKAAEKTELLKGEVIRCIQGESSFSRDMLSELIAKAEAEQNELQKALDAAEEELADTESLKNELSGQYDDLISWAKLYESASIEAKKMIVSCLIKRVEVGRDYKLNVDFNFDLSQFFYGLDFSA